VKTSSTRLLKSSTLKKDFKGARFGSSDELTADKLRSFFAASSAPGQGDEDELLHFNGINVSRVKM
jgi:hypothetical protein